MRLQNDTSYQCLFIYILLCAIIFSNGCSSSTGNVKIDITPPTVPPSAEITYTGNGTVRLEWENVIDTDIKGYNVYWLPGSELDPLSNADSLFTVTNYVAISGLGNDILYSFGISSVDQNNNESAISHIIGKPFSKESPLFPTDLLAVAENIDQPKIILSWAQNIEEDLDHYNIYRAKNPSDVAYSFSFVISVIQENYIDIEVEIGTDYYYRITAVEKGGWESASSSIENDLVLPQVVIVSPVNFEYVNKTPTFLWQKVNGAISYNIVLKTTRIGNEIWNSTIDSSETHIEYDGETELITGNTYYWEVGAISRSEINSISKVGSFVVQDE